MGVTFSIESTILCERKGQAVIWKRVEFTFRQNSRFIWCGGIPRGNVTSQCRRGWMTSSLWIVPPQCWWLYFVTASLLFQNRIRHSFFERHSTFIFISFKSSGITKTTCVRSWKVHMNLWSTISIWFNKEKKVKFDVVTNVWKIKKRSRDDSIHQRPLLLFIQIQLRCIIIRII